MVCSILLKEALEIDGLQHVALKEALEIDGLQHVAEGSFEDRWFAACC